MIMWLSHNKDWFSGLGVTAIVLLGSFLVKFILRIFKPKTVATAQANTPSTVSQTTIIPLSITQKAIDTSFPALTSAINSNPTNAFLSALTPAKIVEDIESVPLFLQDERKKHYVDIPVKWKGSVFSISPLDSLNCRISFFPKEDSGYPRHVIFNISYNDYPAIKLLRKDSILIIEGQIASIDLCINLKNVRIVEGLT